jgi:nucleoside-diphosphate-sugar epimerase
MKMNNLAAKYRFRVASLESMRVLVTGGSGYLGIHIRRFLDADNFSRRCNLDILDSVDVSRVAAYDAVIHLAAHLDKDPAAAELCFRTNAEGTANVLRHMQPNSVFIYASTKDVYGSHATSFESRRNVPRITPVIRRLMVQADR